MVLKQHIASLLLVVIIFNIIELFQANPFNNDSCESWYVPTGSAIIVVVVIEAIYWLIEWGFFM